MGPGKKKKQSAGARDFSDVASVRSKSSDASRSSKRSRQSGNARSERSRRSQDAKRGGNGAASADLQVNLAVEQRRAEVLQAETENVSRELTRITEDFESKRNAHADVLSSYDSRLKAARVEHDVEKDAVAALEDQLGGLRKLLTDLTRAVDVKRVELARHFIPRATAHHAAASGGGPAAAAGKPAVSGGDAIPWDIFPPSVLKLVNPAAGKGLEHDVEPANDEEDEASDLSEAPDTHYEQELVRNAKFLTVAEELPTQEVRVPGLSALKDSKWLAAIPLKKDFRRGESIICRGKRSHEMYRVEQGLVHVVSAGKVVAAHAAGQYFGEAAVFEDTNSVMQIIAVTTPTVCQVLSRDAVLGRLKQGFPTQVECLQKMCRARQASYIRDVLLERNTVLRKYARDETFLAHILPFLHLRAEAAWVTFYERGSVKDDMYFIVSGDFEVRVERAEAYQTINDGFVGEECLATGCRHTTTAVSRTAVVTLRLAERGFHKLITLLPELHSEIQAVCAERLRDLQCFTEFFRHSAYFYQGRGNTNPAFTQTVIRNCGRVVVPPGGSLETATGEVYHIAKGKLAITKHSVGEREVTDLAQHSHIANPTHDPIHSATNDGADPAVVYRFTPEQLRALTAASPQDMLQLNEVMVKPCHILAVDKEARMYRLHLQNQLFQLEEEELGLRQVAAGGADAYRLGDGMADKTFEKSRAVEEWFMVPRPPSAAQTAGVIGRRPPA
eukprot:TRINITY_DN14468_c0_g1_i1.p1 TRINITY_DN14468_c0_g1~~TRINITY_DN14468_c0_g1_i1.p1  ORF type:complete len:729 (+),score=214.72 TRINITY_DN14468_c0_g1_i1:95-2281(+)